jgi:phosphatidylinositol glycan class B
MDTVSIFCAIAEIAYVQVRTLSENAMTVPLVAALLMWRKWPLAAGVALALMVALRLQSAVLMAGFWTASLVMDWRVRGDRRLAAFAPTLWLTAGLVAGLAVVGFMDYEAHGRWFHSARANVQLNVVEGHAARFGTAPFYFYVPQGGWWLLKVSVLALPLLAVGLWVRPSLVWLVGLFVVVHSFIGHKEVASSGACSHSSAWRWRSACSRT